MKEFVFSSQRQIGYFFKRNKTELQLIMVCVTCQVSVSRNSSGRARVQKHRELMLSVKH